MFRRRPPRHAPRPVPRPAREAERLFQEGRFEQAAHRFQNLAREAADRGLWQPAANLHMRAGPAFVEAGLVEPAVENGRRALHALLRAGRPGQARRLFHQILQVLESHGYHTQAQALREEIASRLGTVPPTGVRTPHLQLPTNCPHCGAALNPGAYHQLRRDAVECAYCGSPVAMVRQEC